MTTDRWNLLQGEYEGSPLLVRYRQFDHGVRRDAYPVRLNIFWQMSDPDANGLATPSESAALEAFENRLVEAVEDDGHSVLAAVLTCRGQREFVFQSTDPQGFVGRLTSMPQESDPYPIEIHSGDDPSWEYFDDVTATA